MKRRYIPPELKGMQEAPGFWPVLPAGAKRYSNKLLTQKQMASRIKRAAKLIDEAMKDKP